MDFTADPNHRMHVKASQLHQVVQPTTRRPHSTTYQKHRLHSRHNSRHDPDPDNLLLPSGRLQRVPVKRNRGERQHFRSERFHVLRLDTVQFPGAVHARQRIRGLHGRLLVQSSALQGASDNDKQYGGRHHHQLLPEEHELDPEDFCERAGAGFHRPTELPPV